MTGSAQLCWEGRCEALVGADVFRKGLGCADHGCSSCKALPSMIESRSAAPQDPARASWFRSRACMLRMLASLPNPSP